MTYFSNRRINQFSVKYFRIRVSRGHRTVRAVILKGNPSDLDDRRLLESPSGLREDNVTVTGTKDRCAGASSLPVPVMAAPTVFEKKLQEFIKLEPIQD